MAANDFTNILPRILAAGLDSLRQNAVLPRLINLDYSTEAAMKGKTVDVPIPVAQAVSNVTAAPTYSSAGSTTPAYVPIPLDQWKMTDFFLTDKDMAEIDRNRHFLPMQSTEAIKALANVMDSYVWALGKKVYGFVGTAGTTPFSTVATATDARKVLNQQLAPLADRRVVLDPTSEGQALQLAAFSNFEQTNDQAVKIEGRIGRKFGMDYFMDQNISTFTAGTAASLIVGSTTAVGSSTLGIKTGSSASDGTLILGDVFTIAGDSNTYVVLTTTNATSTVSTDVRIDPPLGTIASANAVITKKATHVMNLAFNRNAFAFATRPLMSETMSVQGGNTMMSATDPVTGLSLRIEVVRQNKQASWQWDVLYGGECVRPQFAARIAG